MLDKIAWMVGSFVGFKCLYGKMVLYYSDPLNNNNNIIIFSHYISFTLF